MPIERNAGSAPNAYLKDPGEYVVRVSEVKKGTSRAGAPMLTVTFETRDGRQINAYFVATLIFHMKTLDLLKAACGLDPSEAGFRAEMLVGRDLGILVEPKEPDERGRVFMQITGFGKAEEVSGYHNSPDLGADLADQVPF
jgi:hypothetical protein